MPAPFHCHDCDKPTMNKCGVCDDCLDEMKQDMLSQFHKEHEQESILAFFDKWDGEKRRDIENTKENKDRGDDL